MTIRIDESEKKRLDAVANYRVLGTPPEAAFDRLAELASELLDTPIALVSFFGRNDQWLKARRGFDDIEVARENSFCFTMVATRQMLMVEDLRSDARFAANKFVTEGGLRSYLGVPLIDASGEVIGSIAGADTALRSFSERQRRSLTTLAYIAMDELALRLAGRELEAELMRRQQAEALLEIEKRRYQHLAHHDALTGRPNRLAFEQRLVAARPGTCLMLFDLDRFKPINDLYGHGSGDAVLRTVGERIAANVRQNDMAARLGGDEFGALLSELSSEAEAAEIAERVLAAIVEPIRIGDNAHFVSASCGIAFLGEDEEKQEFVARADIALYDAKLAGRNTFRLHHRGIDGGLQERDRRVGADRRR